LLAIRRAAFIKEGGLLHPAFGIPPLQCRE